MKHLTHWLFGFMFVVALILLVMTAGYAAIMHSATAREFAELYLGLMLVSFAGIFVTR